MRIDDGQLREKKVITADGRHIGAVVAVEIETEGWQVLCVDVKLERELLDELKQKKPLFGTLTARIAPSHIRTVTDTVLLAVTLPAITELLAGDESGGVSLRTKG